MPRAARETRGRRHQVALRPPSSDQGAVVGRCVCPYDRAVCPYDPAVFRDQYSCTPRETGFSVPSRLRVFKNTFNLRLSPLFGGEEISHRVDLETSLARMAHTSKSPPITAGPTPYTLVHGGFFSRRGSTTDAHCTFSAHAASGRTAPGEHVAAFQPRRASCAVASDMIR